MRNYLKYTKQCQNGTLEKRGDTLISYMDLPLI